MTVLKVLIYAGEGVGQNCLPGMENALDKANIEGYSFIHSRQTIINKSTLTGYDAVFFPGGDKASSLYMNNPNINVADLKTFEQAGGVIVGVCSGAYMLVAAVVAMYRADDLAPDFNATNYAVDGLLNITFTADGQKFFKRTGTLSIDHEGGPVFDVLPGASSKALILATYNGGQYNGQPAIIKDGNVVAFGPHPELTPFYPDMIANAVISTKFGAVAPTETTFTLKDIATASIKVLTFITQNKRLPNFVGINNIQVNMNELLNLMSMAVLEISKNQTQAIPLSTVNPANAPSGTYKNGDIKESEYLTLAQALQTFITKNGRLPDYATTSLGNIPTNDLIYNFTKLLNFYSTNNRLPAFVECLPIVTVVPTYVRMAPYDYFFQQTDYWCGPTSWLMELSSYDIYPLGSEVSEQNDEYDAEQVIANAAGTQLNENGTGHQGMIDVATWVNNKFGHKLSANFLSLASTGIEGLAKGFSAGNRYICNIMTGDGSGWEFPQYTGIYGHYIVIVGVDVATQTVTVADPDRNVETIPFSTLLYAASLISSPSLLQISGS